MLDVWSHSAITRLQNCAAQAIFKEFDRHAVLPLSYKKMTLLTSVVLEKAAMGLQMLICRVFGGPTKLNGSSTDRDGWGMVAGG